MRTERLDSTPSNTFLVGRLKRHLWTSSWIGGLVTNRDSTLSGDYNRVVGTDAHFQFFRKLDIDAYLLGSDTPGRSGRNQARRVQTGWTDEELVASAEYNAVQPNFNPEVGFIRRRDMEQYSGDVAWRPLLRQSDLIRNFNVGTALDYYEGSGSGEIETRVSDTTLGIVFESNASVNFVFNNTFDRLNNPLPIPSGNPHVTIPAGDYTFERYTGQFTTNQRRKVSGSGTLSWGDFYGGDRTQVTAGLTQTELSRQREPHLRSQRGAAAGGRFHDGPGWRQVSLWILAARVPQRLPSVQRRYAPRQLEHPLRSHSSSAQRFVHRLQRHSRHPRRPDPRNCLYRQADESFQFLTRHTRSG
jgi:hypothetical protein